MIVKRRVDFLALLDKLIVLIVKIIMVDISRLDFNLATTFLALWKNVAFPRQRDDCL